MVKLEPRATEPELLDIERPTPERLARFCRFLQFVNFWFGGRRAVTKTFERFAARWPVGKTVWILDVGTGSADIPRALIRWGRREGRLLKIVALDREEDTLAFAHRCIVGFPEIILLRANAEALPFHEKSFDYVLSNLFFHHLTDEGVFAALSSFDRLARSGVVVNDLLRSRRLYRWTRFFSLFCEKPLRHDNLLSVRKAFTIPEVLRISRRVGLDYLEVRAVFGHRFILSGERGIQ